MLKYINGFTIIRALFCLCVLLPFVYLLITAFAPPSQHWQYVKEHMLPTYLWETFVLAVGCGICTLVLGVAMAWLVTMHDFRGKRFFEIAFILPLAIPPYIAAYAYDGFFNYTGTLQSVMRNCFSMEISGIELLAMVWGIFIFSITLFPYVYMLVRTFLRNQSASIIENALMLGGGGWRMFAKVAWPLIMPAATAGMILACLEVLNDFGMVSYFGLNTFTTAIFSAWFGMGDSDTAVKLSAILLGLVLAVLMLRKALQRAQRYRIVSSREKPFTPRRLSNGKQAMLLGLCALVALASFFLPLGQMLYWLYFTGSFTPSLLQSLGYTLQVALLATLLIMVVATATINANRMFGGKYASVLGQITTLGYSIPSAVLAIGVITLFVSLDSWLQSVSAGGFSLTMSSAMLIFALSVRFFTIGYQSVETGFAKVGMIYSEASRTLGRGVSQTFFRVDLPMVRHAILSGAVLVFIDILKELPLSLILRPFNSETLGTTVYHYVNNEVLEEIALPSLLIVMAGTVFILLMQYLEQRSQRSK